MLWKRKGISPLIATVLIIGFTVALAAIIMTWGSSFTKGMQSQAEESSNVQMKCAQDVQIVVDKACYDSTAPAGIKVVVKNNGGIDIINLTARVFESPTLVAVADGIKDAANKAGISKYGISTFKLVSGAGTPPAGIFTALTVKKVEVIPVISVGGALTPCAQTLGEYGDAEGTALDACSL